MPVVTPAVTPASNDVIEISGILIVGIIILLILLIVIVKKWREDPL